MKQKYQLILFFMFFCHVVFAQQKPQYSQYIFNNYLINPAISGIENYVDIKLGYRTQWSSVEGAPATYFVTANQALGDNYLWRNPLSMSTDSNNPMSNNYMQNYTASSPHHGVGVTLVSDKIGPISRTDVNLTYAYHLRLSNQYNLSAGVGAGFSRILFDANSLTLENQNDPSLHNIADKQLKPDLNLGLFLYEAHLFVGISAQQVLPQSLASTAGTKAVPHFFITSGYRFMLAEDIAATPSIMYKKVENTPNAFDLNIKLDFKDKFLLGGSFRNKNSFSAMLGFNYNQTFNLIYAYDFDTSAFGKLYGGTHEIVLGILLGSKYKVSSSIFTK